ncbi:hypothetical protein OH77DRAFT_1040547 [Trametes cingulata]|nr:hypothetical protein OH77DRAFT_1040547 [Trametes cingulata]
MAGRPTARPGEHHTFLIARVNSKNDTLASYRCVGAFRDEGSRWYSGFEPLVALNRFLSLILQEENAAAVQGELNELEHKYDHPSAEDANAAKSPPVPCPYTVSLLSMAWTTSKEGCTKFLAWPMDVGLLDANLGCWDLQTLYGHTIVDISNPRQPAYCFLLKPSVPILSAYEFLSWLYDLVGEFRENDPSDLMQRFMDPLLDRAWHLIYITELSGYPLIPLSALRQAWPTSFFTRRANRGTLSVPGWVHNGTVFAFLRYVRITESANTSALDPPADWEVTRAETLLGIVLGVLAQPSADDDLRARCGEIVTSLLREPALFDFVLVQSVGAITLSRPRTVEEAVKRHLARSPLLDDWLYEPTRGTHYISILEVVSRLRMTPGNVFLDLSGFQLSARKVYRLLRHLPDVESLSLAGNSRVGTWEIWPLFKVCDGLKRVNIMGCPSVDDEELQKQIIMLTGLFPNIEGIWHRSLLTIHKPPFYPVGFTLMYANYEQMTGIALPFFTPTLVLQALTRFVLWLLPDHMETTKQKMEQSQSAGGYIDMSALERVAFNALSRAPRTSSQAGEWWLPQVVVNVPGYPYAWVSPAPVGSWAFCVDWAPARGRRRYGFVHYRNRTPAKEGYVWPEAAYEPRTDDRLGLSTASVVRQGAWTMPDPLEDTESDTWEDYETQLPPRYSYSAYASTRSSSDFSESSFGEMVEEAVLNMGPAREGVVYDLRGFLRCMADEGRPLPPATLVDGLDALFLAKECIEGDCIQRFMQQHEVPRGFTFPFFGVQAYHDAPDEESEHATFRSRTARRKFIRMFWRSEALGLRDEEGT